MLLQCEWTAVSIAPLEIGFSDHHGSDYVWLVVVFQPSQGTRAMGVEMEFCNQLVEGV